MARFTSLQDPLFRLLAVNLAGGVAVGLLFVLGLFALDAGRLQTLIRGDESGALALLMLAGGFVVTCGSLSMATAVMSRASYRAAGERRGRG